MVYNKRVRSLRGRIKGVEGGRVGSWRGRIKGVEVEGGGWGTRTGALWILTQLFLSPRGLL